MDRLPASPPAHFDAHCSRASGSCKLVLGICVFLALITWLVFGQTLRHDFVNYDDSDYVYANAEVTKGLTLHGIGWAFTHVHSHNWHPLTSMSHMLDCQLYGLKAGGHHCTNVVLHMLGVILLFLVLFEMTGGPSSPRDESVSPRQPDRTGDIWRSSFVAALFAIHPLHVESVAWVSERKDVLSGVFFMLTLAAYVRYVRKPSLASYLLVALLFALGLMSKPMLVTLPFVLLLLDYWPLNRGPATAGKLRSDPPMDGFAVAEVRGQRIEGGRLETQNVSNLILEKLPLVLLSVASCLVTLIVQQRSMGSIQQLPLAPRLINAFPSNLTYLDQMFWPAGLALFYPYLSRSLTIWLLAAAVLLPCGISAGAFALRKKYPYGMTGWFWYLGMLAPVIGIVQVGSQAHADRYTYLPHIGLYLAVTWAVSDLFARWRHRGVILATAAASAIVAFGWWARVQTSYWKKSEAIWNHTLAVTENNLVAHGGLGELFLMRNQLDDAMFHFQEVLRIHSEFGAAPDGKAIAYAHTAIGHALLQKNEVNKAIFHYRQALQAIPDYRQAALHLGRALFQEGRIDEAIACWQKILSSHPDDADTHTRLGDALVYKRLTGDALAHYEKALQITPGSVVTLNSLAWALATGADARFRNGSRAVQLAQQADQLAQGKNPVFVRTLAAAYAESGRFNDAIDTAQRALQKALAKGDSALASKLQMDIDLYRMNFPMR